MLQLKVARWKKLLLCMNSNHVRNLNFLFLSLFAHLFKNCPFQFLSHWQGGTQLSSLQKPNQKPDSQFVGGKIQICLMENIFVQRATFNKI